MHKFDEARWGTALSTACTKVAMKALQCNRGSLSTDVVETVSQSFADCAATFSNRLHLQGLDDGVLVSAVHYVADVLTHAEVGHDVPWFGSVLDAVLEVAAPTRYTTPDAELFLQMMARRFQK